ncbi:MAG: dihydroneopterin aldolase [Bacteroidales bacterium]|jgi:dihydroneopterin aldolase|nr:dihydroneopterin aldolase [Bacteroidales bacterium]
MKASIKLTDMQFYAYHGVMAQETKVGNNYVVNVCMTADLLRACETDNVDDTISYALIFDLVKAEMKQPSKLLEHVAMRIYKSIKSGFPQITALEVRLAKNNPPISGDVKSAEIIIAE